MAVALKLTFNMESRMNTKDSGYKKNKDAVIENKEDQFVTRTKL